MAKNSVLTRLVSVVAAAVVLAVTVFYPRLIAEDGAHVPFPFLVLTMIGMSFCWVHGFGFIPKNRILQFAFSPWIAWPVIAAGAAGILISH